MMMLLTNTRITFVTFYIFYKYSVKPNLERARNKTVIESSNGF